MKKTLIVSNTAGLITDFLDNDFKILKEKGYKIECACNMKYLGKNSINFFKKYDVKIYDVDFPIRSLNMIQILNCFLILKKILKNNNYNLIHCHSTIAATITRICSKKYRKKKNALKVIYTSHGFPFYEGNHGIKAKMFYHIEKYLSKYTDAILTICKEDYNNAKNMRCDNVYLMHGVGVDVNKFINTKPDEKFKEKLGICKNNKVILSIGEINSNKNHEIIIRALSKLNKRNIVYAICGREVSELGKKCELQKLANDLNVKVLFLGFRDDIHKICHCSDIGALPSFKEGLGLAGIEMLASGLPIVGSNRQGIKDYVIDGKTGYLMEPDDIESTVAAIENTFKIYKNKEIIKNCIDMSKKFGINQAYNVILNAYNKLKI